MAVDIDITIVDYASEVERHAHALPKRVGTECLTIPSLAHRLEAACASAALCPGLLKLEVVGQVERAPRTVVKRGRGEIGVLVLFRDETELPSEIEQRVLLCGKFGQRAVALPCLFLHVLILCPCGHEAAGVERHDQRRGVWQQMSFDVV